MVLSGLLYLLLAACSSALLAIFLRAFQSETDNRYGIIFGNYLTCVILGFALMPERSEILAPDKETLICGLISGVLFILTLVLMQTSIRANGAILTSAFSRLGLIVPLLISIFWGGERPAVVQWIGLALVFAAMRFIYLGNKEENGENATKPEKGSTSQIGFLLLVCMLLASGITDTMSKVFEQVGNREQDTLYVFLIFLFAGCLSVLLLWMEYKKTGRKLTLKNLLAGITVGIPNYFSTALLLQALVKLPAFIVYPTFSTGAMLIVTLVSAVVFKEKPGRMRLIGLCIILAALVLLNI